MDAIAAAAVSAVTSLAGFFWSHIVPLAIEAAVWLLAVGLLDRILPRAVWPELRLAVGAMLLLKLVLPLGWISPLPFVVLPEKLLVLLPSFEVSLRETWRGPAIALACVWFAGVLVILGLGLSRARQMSRLWRQAEPARRELADLAEAAAHRLGRRRAPPVRTSENLASPCVFGLRQPWILLPPDLSPQMAEHALLHEIAHVRRGDLLLAAFLGLLQAIYFFHPLVHLAARRLAGLRELCCDRFVARRLDGELAAYRRTLLTFAARQHREALAALPFAGRSSLLERLRALERAERDRPFLRRGLTTLGAALALACAVPMAPPAERGAARVAELINKPPGCLQLRYLVMERMAAEIRQQQENEAKEPR